MKKVFVSVEECIPGMQIAETVFNDYGAVIVAENTILDEHMLSKINKLGIIKIKVYDQVNEMIMVSGTELFRAQYNESVNTVKDILHDISSGKNIDIKKVNAVSDSIISRINENRDIVSSINQMRSADEYTYTHSVNVSLLCMLIGKWSKFDFQKVKSLVYAGFLHDVGKGRIPIEILNKPGALTKDEFEEMKKHSQYGYKIVENIPNLDDGILKGILMHHERDDGSGYPYGLKGDQIHEFAKIIAVADIYDAMTSNRSYREKESPFEVFELMEKDTFGVLDHKVTSIFLNNIASYYIGDIVKLSTGDIGEIVYINPTHISQPIVKVDNIYIDLAFERHIKVLEII
jgi:HD-GYP domain-containing protein (c-di-GMP phosphodiesterase class II)